MLIVVLCTVALGQLALGQEPLVTTSQGTMKGKVLKSRGGRDFFSFTKIPYAKPPVGERRFMISEKSDNWTGTLDATQNIPKCYHDQFNFTFLNMFHITFKLGQEDCLYLNVFTPNLTVKLPVIFSIHGGAFARGSAWDLGSAEYFMDEDVVIVAPNYRLGTLGFLSLEDNVIPGNMGLKDQALALEWTHKEISAFGGDPNLITVIGESADLICAAPRTNGLIKGCVSQSMIGWADFAIFNTPGKFREKALNMAKVVGCTDTGDLLKCLQNKPVEILMAEDRSFFPSPNLEPANTPGALLTSWPTSEKQNYPWIVGVCQDSGMLYTISSEMHWEGHAETDMSINSFNDSVIKTFHLENRPDDVRRIRERFFKKGIEPLIAIRNFITEGMFVYTALKSISNHSGPTYYYKFNYTRGPSLIADTNITAAPHGAEMAYFFGGIPGVFGKSPKNWPKPEDVTLSKKLVKMWVNFARDQTPSSKETLQWPQFQGQYYLDIQDTGVKISKMTDYQETLDFWKSIIHKESKSSTMQSPMFLIALACIYSVFKQKRCEFHGN